MFAQSCPEQQQQQQGCLSQACPLFLVRHLFSVRMDPGGQPTSAAQRRKGRRLRAALSHERQSIAMALAEFTHHSSRGLRMARAGRWVRDEVHGRVPEAPTPQEPRTQHIFLDDGRRQSRSSESRGASWSSLSTVRRSSLCSTLVSRRWWTPWWKCGRSSITCCLTSSRLSKCPRFFLTRSRSAPLCCP